MKQQQRKTWESYAGIRFPALIGADNNELVQIYQVIHNEPPLEV
jgi:hypothetical protein